MQDWNQHSELEPSSDQILDYTHTDSRKFMSGVFGWMFFGLALSAAMAFWFASTDMWTFLFDPTTGSPTMLYWITAIAPLGFILVMNFGIKKLSPTALVALFIAFATVMGISLCSIFLMYSATAIVKTFAISSLTFGAMAVLGYTTKTDLTKFGAILYMGVIGLIIAMVINIFLASSMMDYIISIIGVLIFTGLTAYDTQKLKQISFQVDAGTAEFKKGVIMGATSLYLNFLNLFLFMLRLFGGRD